MFEYLEDMRSKLELIDGVKTCRIGIEAALSPVDYPIVRIVPTRLIDVSVTEQKLEVVVYYGRPIHESTEGVSGVLMQLFEMEDQIKAALKTGAGYKAKHIDTVTDDQDVEEHFKLFASRFEVMAIKKRRV